MEWNFDLLKVYNFFTPYGSIKIYPYRIMYPYRGTSSQKDFRLSSKKRLDSIMKLLTDCQLNWMVYINTDELKKLKEWFILYRGYILDSMSMKEKEIQQQLELIDLAMNYLKEE